MRKQFEGLKVIDASTVLAGPSVGMFFAELGANVIKIEHPTNKDVTRSWKLSVEPKDSNVSAYFSSVNYGKSYQSLDLSNKKDKQQFLDLIQDADIVLFNFKNGTLEKFGLTETTLRKSNPSLIIGEINGFGSEDDRVAYDLIIQAESGIMSINGDQNTGPLKMPIALIDVLAAHHLKEGLLIELIEKAKKGNDYQGKTVTVSLYEAAISSLVNQASNYLMTGEIPVALGSLHPNIAPYGEIFITKDGGLITFAIGSDHHFYKLCNWLKRDDIPLNEKFRTVQNRVVNRMELFEILKTLVNRHELNDLIEGMHSLKVPCAQIKNLKQVFETTHAQSMVLSETIEGIATKRVTSIAFKTK